MLDSKLTFEGRVAPSNAWQPRIFNTTLPSDNNAIEELMSQDRGIQVFDQIESQLRDLIKIRNPSRKLSPGDLDLLVRAHAGPSALRDYGAWVFYPWSKRLVHVLDRNARAVPGQPQQVQDHGRLKQARLATRRVGVVGLSVGQSVALAMSLERSFGEIRLADFDTIDLSNLNRLRAGIHSVGVPKVYVTAREIFEIDPYLQVTAFPEGLTLDNLEQFFFGGGPLDVVIDECDDLAIKVLVRLFARKHRIPVVMDTSDRGLVDVERFDLEPDSN